MTTGQNSPPEQTLVLADDHVIVREAIAGLCAKHGFRIVGQCSDGSAAVEMVLAERPDFAVLDLHMPVITGIEAIRQIRAAGCRTKLMILSMSRDQGLVKSALASGADAYVLKDGPSRHLIEAFTFVGDGGVYVSPLLRGAGIFADSGTGAVEAHPLAPLSPRELEVFSCLVQGLRPKDIAARLDISPKTVDTYRASVLRKLNVRDVVGLVRFAVVHDLANISPPR